LNYGTSLNVEGSRTPGFEEGPIVAACRITPAQQDALAHRIAVVLSERKRIAEERLKRERETCLRNSERARERYQVRIRVGER
jgi:hypothetical protein